MYLDTEDDDRADGRDDVGDDQRNVRRQNAVDNKKHTAETQHDKRRQSDAVGVAGAYRHDSLWHIAENHADARQIADNIL